MMSWSERRSRRPLELLWDRAFGPFVVGRVLSSCGSWIQQIAAAVLMFELTRSALLVGAVSVVLFGGPLVLALWTGALTDLLDRRKLLMVGRGLSTTAAGALATLLLVRGVDEFGGPAVLLVGAGVMGIGHSLSAPAMQALTPGLVANEDLEQALAYASVAPSIARTVGPALGGGLLLLGGPGLAFAAAAAMHAILVAVLAMIRVKRPQRRVSGRPGIFGGIRYVLANRTVGLVLVAIALLGFGVDPVITLTPPLAAEMGGDELVGLFASAFGVGALIAVLVFQRLRTWLSLRRTGVVGYLVVALGLVIVGAFGSVAGVVAGFLVAGWGFMIATVTNNTRIQRGVPDELRGRVMALWGVAFLGSRPIAAPINGAIADATSVTIAMFAAAAVVLTAVLLANTD